MSEAKDPTIKLFGKMIPLPELTPASGSPIFVGTSSSTPLPPSDPPVNESIHQDRPYSPEHSNSYRLGKDREPDKDPCGIKLSDAKQKDEAADTNSSAVVNDNPKTPSSDNEASTSKTLKTEEDQNEISSSQEKTLKKPDKIFPCPRCNSMDTKFCYFNNYNVNQPRHFCKNCQRYWTAGGTVRNVPVGAGRRKNKNSVSHYRRVVVSETFPNGAHYPNLNPNGSILSFGSDTRLCESIASVLNIEEKTIQNHAQNGFVKPGVRIPVLYGGGEKMDDHSSQSSVIASNSKDEAGKNLPQDPRMQNCHSFPPQILYFPGAPWPYPWNSAQWNPLTFFPPGFPLSFYPAPNVPWVTALTCPPIRTGPNSPTLGKHSRDENMLTIPSSGQEDSDRL